MARVTEWASAQGMSVEPMVTEVGAALNARHRKFLAVLRDPGVERIIVEHRDRFARFALEYVRAVLAAQGRELLVVEP